ncbi:MAG TPA: M15 family metallopeptidase [Beijerinckiaceae bacterium]|nr:M15 family metallopeptidase [Beijerinckiaceae bacterium]
MKSRWLPLVASLLAAGPVLAEPSALDSLVAAYPAVLAGHDGTHLMFRDGTRLAVSDGRTGKSFDEKLRSASILDQMSLPYPKGPLTGPPGPQDDPGRFRNQAFFDKIYGDCSRGGVRKSLVRVPWLPKSGGGTVEITSINGVADRLRAVSEDLDRLPLEIRKFAFPSAGTFNCRTVKDTGARSMHAWGAAIDLNTRYSDYWLWSKGKGYRNRIPFEIVAVFERHGFIWGGKWGHYDTMHFEYRPELLQ